nr:MAG TPA: hypothetical protein [Caudoviricetes sp.]
MLRLATLLLVAHGKRLPRAGRCRARMLIMRREQ